MRTEAPSLKTNFCRQLLPICATILLLTVTARSELRNDRWRWSNPLPHGNNVLDLFVSTNLSLQVGDAGSLYIQRVGGRWAPAYTGVQNYLRSVTLFGDRIIATGEDGCIIWSDDGESFQSAELTPSNTLDWFEGVTASPQRAVAVGDYGTIYSTTTGTNWTADTSGTTEWLRGVSFGKDVFIAVGENGTIRRRSNGASWSAVASGTTEHLNRVRYLSSFSGGQFVAVGNSGIVLASSSGDAPWTILNSGTTNDLFDVAANNSGILLAGDGELRVRIDDGTSWTDYVNSTSSNAPPDWTYLSAYGTANSWLVAGRTGLLMESDAGGSWTASPSDSPHAWLWDMTVQNGMAVAVGDLATIQTSLDGILWASEAVPVSRTNTVLLGVGGTSNLLIAAGSDGTVLLSQAGTTEQTVTNQASGTAISTNITVSTFGLVWTNLTPFTTNSLQGVATGNGLYILTGDAGTIFTSPDGTNWTERSTPAPHFLSGVAIGTDACVAVGASGTLLRSGPDGSSWTAASMGTTDWLYRVRWLNGLFVAVGQNGSLYTSPDASSWTARNTGTARWLTDITYTDNTWFVTGYQGTLLSSTNLTDWVSQPLPTGKSLFAAGSRNGQLILAGIEGVLLRNQILAHTSPVEILAYNQTTVTGTDSTAGTYETFLFGGQPDQMFEFLSCTNLTETWEPLANLEVFDASGTIYLQRTRDTTNMPPAEFYRAIAQ